MFVAGRHPGIADVYRLWSEHVPACRPHIGRGSPQRLRMLLSEQGAVRIVIHIDQLLAPPERHGASVLQYDTNQRPEGVRPLLDWTERRCGPVYGAHQRTHGTG